MTPNEKQWWKDRLTTLGSLFLVISAVWLWIESVF